MSDRLPHPVVLLVEDEWLVRMEMADSLTEAGFDVVEAGTGEAAIALIAGGRVIDVLVTDIRLGGSASGWDVADAWRAAFPGLPVVYASANSRDENRMVLRSIFLEKPSRTDVLVATCRGMIP